MSLGNKLRHAEEFGARAAHLSADRVRSGIHSAEATLHKLTVRRKKKPATTVSASAQPKREAGPEPKVRTGIVSVNGRDVGEMHCTGGRH
jgi:hypothetical protein